MYMWTYMRIYSGTPSMRTPLFNQVTVHGPSYIEKYTKLPLK